MSRVIDEATLTRELTADYQKENPEREVRAQEALFKRLGYLKPDADLTRTTLELLGTAVAGFYSPDTKQIAVVQRSGRFTAADKVTLAHEYTHALQDQHFDLGKIDVDDETQTDRSLARLALIEGDATLAMSQWMDKHLTQEELGEVIAGSSDPKTQAVLDRMPPILLRQLAFPYVDGLSLATTLHAGGGWAAVNRAYGALPESTEQVLHQEKYRLRERPVAVALPDLGAALGNGWKQSVVDTLGELNVQVWLAQANGPTRSREGAAGWGGDRIASYDGPNGRWAVAWRIDWDRNEDARQFAEASREVTRALSGSTRVVEDPAGNEVPPNRVEILVASDAETLDALNRALGH